MRINDLIKKGRLIKAAMLTSATIATEEMDKLLTVAEVATVAGLGINSRHDKLSNIEKQKILDWLNYIGEEDPVIIDEVLETCRNNIDSLNYFLQRAELEN